MNNAKFDAVTIESSKKVETMLDDAVEKAKKLDEAKPIEGKKRLPHLHAKTEDKCFFDVCKWLNMIMSNGSAMLLRPLAKEKDGREHCMLAYPARNACIDVWLHNEKYDEIIVW